MADNDIVGPQLPPHLLEKRETERVAQSTEQRLVGPTLPPHLRAAQRTSDDEDPVKSDAVIGPALPPHLKNDPSCSGSSSVNRVSKKSPKRKKISIGPVLPPHLQHLAANGESDDSDDSSADSESGRSEPDKDIGPAPHLQGGEYDMRKEFADRQRRAEDAQSEAPARDTWMTELPRDRTGVKLGTGPRTFTKRDATEPTLDAGWTDTPGQAGKSKDDEKRAEDEQLVLAQRKRDAEIDKQLEEYNSKKRSKPLIDMHKEEKSKKSKKSKKEKKDKKSKKKSKKSKDDSKESTDRKPFNWEEDMRVSMVDTTRAKGMLDKTVLQSRFSTGRTQKYL